jgi:hypothetical protein
LGPYLGYGKEIWILLDSNRHFLKDVGVPADLSLEQVWMVAHLSELHNQVHQIFHLGLVLFKLEEVASGDLVLDPLIQDSLPISHLAGQFNLGLLPDLLLDIPFKSSEHEGL